MHGLLYFRPREQTSQWHSSVYRRRERLPRGRARHACCIAPVRRVGQAVQPILAVAMGVAPLTHAPRKRCGKRVSGLTETGSMQTFQFVALLLHILAAMIWVGGMVFLGVVLVPILRDPSLRPQAVHLVQRTGRRFRNLGWFCLLVLVLTGIVNLGRWGVNWDRFSSSALWRSPWGHLLAVKLSLVAAAMALSLLHDFIVGPCASAKLREAPGSVEAQRLRRLASWMGRANLLLGIGIVAFAIMLVRGSPT